jgi:uncharacterized membrane protein
VKQAEARDKRGLIPANTNQVLLGETVPYDHLMDQWMSGLRISHRAHFEAAKYYERLHLRIGIPTVIISALLGTTVFANFQHSDNEWIKALLSVLSVAMIALSSLQTFLKYSERSERHRTAAVQLGEVRRELEELLAFNPQKEIDKTIVDVLRKKWDSVDRQAPTIPTKIYVEVESFVVAAKSRNNPG